MSSIENEDILPVSEGVSSQILLRLRYSTFCIFVMELALQMQVTNQIRFYPTKVKLDLFYYGWAKYQSLIEYILSNHCNNSI